MVHDDDNSQKSVIAIMYSKVMCNEEVFKKNQEIKMLQITKSLWQCKIYGNVTQAAEGIVGGPGQCIGSGHEV